MLLTVVLPILIRSAALLSVALEVLTRLWVHLLLGAASLFWSPLATLLDFCGWQRDEELSSADDGGLRTAALDPRVEGSFVFSNSAFEPSSSEDSSEAVSSEPSEDTAVLLLLRQGSTKKGSPRALVLQRGMSGIALRCPPIGEEESREELYTPQFVQVVDGVPLQPLEYIPAFTWEPLAAVAHRSQSPSRSASKAHSSHDAAARKSPSRTTSKSVVSPDGAAMAPATKAQPASGGESGGSGSKASRTSSGRLARDVAAAVWR